ncbi:hypothetical protein FACS189434_06670 [Bacteroidia bacterium]|nr:hypothetical protein FACS189434_06670 [Bacteroidia bacterium]
MIHAGAKPFKIETALPNEATVDEIEMISTLNYCEENDLFSAIIGSVEIVDCVKGHQSIWAIKDSERKSYCHWVLANPVIFENPVLNVKGRLSFWESGYDEITCPECGSRQLHNFVDGGISHRCEFCENYILEGEF